MVKYLLVILILTGTFIMKIKASFSQTITISYTGRETILSLRKGTPAMLDDSSADNDRVTTNENDNANQISRLKKIAHSKPDLKPVKIFSSPLLKRLYVTSDFGERYNPVLHKEAFHTGIDLRAYYDTVLSIARGIILKEGYSLKAGNFLIIQHGNGIESIYCHLSSFLLEPGDQVIAGGKVAISGATGAVTGPHLHFALKIEGKFADPVPLLKIIEQFNRKENH